MCDVNWLVSVFGFTKVRKKNRKARTDGAPVNAAGRRMEQPQGNDGIDFSLKNAYFCKNTRN